MNSERVSVGGLTEKYLRAILGGFEFVDMLGSDLTTAYSGNELIEKEAEYLRLSQEYRSCLDDLMTGLEECFKEGGVEVDCGSCQFVSTYGGLDYLVLPSSKMSCVVGYRAGGECLVERVEGSCDDVAEYLILDGL